MQLSGGTLACTAPMRYYPDPENTLYEALPSHIVTGDAPWIAEQLFNSLVENGSEQKLKEINERIRYGRTAAWGEGYTEGVQAACGSPKPTPKPAPKQ
jgi:hypothetical protein